MIVAIPVTQGEIPNHLGHCDEFLLAEVEASAIRSVRMAKNPGHGPGGPPPMFVRDQGVTHVLAWGMPPHAQGLFAQFGIVVQLGVKGDPRHALEAWLAGKLVTTGEALDAGGSCGASPHDHDHDD
jgi:predicted Fe-Mo cluster-binding NifX family protein